MINVIRTQSAILFKRPWKEMGIYLVRFNGKTGIVRCNHKEKENVIEVLKSINSINSQKVKIVTVGTSGTIKALKKKHLTNFY